MTMHQLEWFLKFWPVVQQWIIIGLIVWYLPKLIKKILPLLRHDSAASLERKIFSFDEAYLAKVITSNKGLISNVNKAAEKLFGWNEAEILGKSYEILIPEKDRAAFNEQLNVEDDEHDERISLTNALHKNKQEIPVEVVFRKKRLYDELFYLVVIRDRTQEVIKIKKFEQYIEILKLKIDILSRGEQIANTGSWLWDLKTKEKEKAITASENYKRIVGLLPGPNSYSIDNIRPRVWPNDTKIVDNALDGAINRGEDYDIKFRMMRGVDFQVIHIRSQVKVFTDADGVVVALAGVATLLKTENLSDASRAEEIKL